MSDILEEFQMYISTNKEVLGALPVNNKKNRKVYVEKVDEYLDTARKIDVVIMTELRSRYDKITNIPENQDVLELEKTIENFSDIDLFNELNTPFEKLGLDKIIHSLESFFEGNLDLLNENVKQYIDTFKKYGIILTAEDFVYSDFVREYMEVFFTEYNASQMNIDVLKKKFEQIYWKCPDIVTHLQLNLRYLYALNEKKIVKELNTRNEETLESLHTDKNGLVRKFFDLNEELIQLKRADPKIIVEKFENGAWRVNDFTQKQLDVLYDRVSERPFDTLTDAEKEEFNKNLGKLLNTLQEYKVYKKFKYIYKDILERTKDKDKYKTDYENKLKELKKKEQELLKNNSNNKKLVKRSKNPLFILFRKKFERKIYDFPVAANNTIKELSTLYTELDQAKVNTRIAEFVDDTCTIKYVFKIAISFYTYAYELVKANYENEEDNTPLDELQYLIDFINQPYKVMLNNIKVVEEPDILSIISNRYKILNIKVEKEDLLESLDSLMQDVSKILDNYNIQKSKISMDDMAFIEKAKPMINKK